MSTVPDELLARLATPPPTPEPAHPADRRVAGRGLTPFDVEAYLSAHGIAFTGPVPYRGGQKWRLDACVWAGHDDRAAVVWQAPDGKICANCSHNSCEGKGWKELRDAVEPGRWQPSTPEDAPDTGAAGLDEADAFDEASSFTVARPFPAPPADEAYHGLIGEIVRCIEPHTEAAPVAILVQLLVALGNLIGRGPHSRAEADSHHLNLMAVLVGDTAMGRKGTSWGYVRRIAEIVDLRWARSRIQSGMSSGEGIIYAVRDRRTKDEVDKRTGQTVEVVVDEGVSDKRLLVQEGEFGRALAAAERSGNTLTAVIRSCWDTGDLQTLTKTSPDRASGAHVSLIAHITREELLRLLSTTDAANGFGNRMIWIATTRSKVLPFGGNLDEDRFAQLANEIGALARLAMGRGELKRDEEANALWGAIYGDLSAAKPGLLGALTTRGVPQVMRLATLYALFDAESAIRAAHLRAALAIWAYSEASARWIFGDALGDPDADAILRVVRQEPEGLTRTDLMNHFGRNLPAARINRAIVSLAEHHLIRIVRERTDGRTAERFVAVG